MGRTFTILKKQMDQEKFNDFCVTIVLEYANSPALYAAKYFCNRYDITKSCYQKIKDYVVVNNLINDTIVQLMIQKSIKNQMANCEKAGSSTIIKYERLMEEREKNKCKRIAELFAYNPTKSKKELASMMGITTREVDTLLLKAIEENIVTDVVVDAIERRSIKNAKKGTVEEVKLFFKGIRLKREFFKKEVALN